MKLTPKDFMAKASAIIGDRTDDEALSFLEDCKDTITEDKDDYKEKYEAAVKEKEELDKQWRTKYKERFYSSDDQPQDKDKDKGNGNKNPMFSDKSEAQITAENTTINSLFSEEGEK